MRALLGRCCCSVGGSAVAMAETVRRASSGGLWQNFCPDLRHDHRLVHGAFRRQTLDMALGCAFASSSCSASARGRLLSLPARCGPVAAAASLLASSTGAAAGGGGGGGRRSYSSSSSSSSDGGGAVVRTDDASNNRPPLSKRIDATDVPIIFQMAKVIAGNKDIMSLGQGVVHWLPPDSALKAAEAAVYNPKCSGYGIDDGIPELRDVLVKKIATENNLVDSSIMVTSGANQAFVNVVMALCDPEDPVVLFVPYYFNHLMAFQMSGVKNFLFGRRDPNTLYPDPEWLRDALKGPQRPKLVVITNPDNPAGTYVPRPILEEISRLCAEAGCWLVLDNTYEYFMYGGREHLCLEGPHMVNIFSFSKAYGMMGWRVGYIAYPNCVSGLGMALVKAQDTIPICANLVAQHAALAAATEGRAWVDKRVRKLDVNVALARDALSPLGEDAVKGGEGAIYMWAKLPNGFVDDRKVVQWLADRHGVVVIPGSASGSPGHFRVSFANLPEEKYAVAAGRLKLGLSELTSQGLVGP